ncbi:DUF998 domain-containing protein [Nonomuraea lactucae]|uniref:DUF998 domain-containing protein n=1 Tax=Nonomuraea lactucae TaxID=2249762 RepID=UPI000DE1B14F|nr:DUF998 domain-containing protein [Nonomuraea lactucae]
MTSTPEPATGTGPEATFSGSGPTTSRLGPASGRVEPTGARREAASGGGGPSAEGVDARRRRALLLGCGTVAGFLFPVVSFAQAFTRTGFDLRRHALSDLTLGDLGWLQTANFALTGLLACAFAIGTRRAVRSGLAGVLGPALIGVYGVAMVGGGIFTTDPALGWPPGAPAGVPEHVSTNSAVHMVFAASAFMSLMVAGLVFARGIAGRGWATYSVVSMLATFVLTVPPWSEDSASLRFAVGAVLISAWLVALSLRLRRN